MTVVRYDSADSDSERRENLFKGDIYVYSPSPISVKFCEFARAVVEEHFDGWDPRFAQFDMEVDEFATVLGRLKPTFIHHTESKGFLQQLIVERGCDASQTYFEVPKLRSATSDQYLTSGIAYSWHPHRDTWYSAPRCQVNWWMPVYDIEADNCMAFHLKYWNRAVDNDSADYNYYEWNRKHRGPQVARMIGSDPRPLPKALEEIDLEPDLRVVCPVGGTILFSAAHLHSSVPNTSGQTRFSIDFRTAHLEDLAAGQGAPNADSSCTGTVLHEFLSVQDLSALHPSIVAGYEDGTEGLGPKVFPAPD